MAATKKNTLYSSITETKSNSDSSSKPIYKPSSDVNTAKNNLNTTTEQKPAAYSSQYSPLVQNNLNKILNREPFSYDASADKLYQQYKDSYTRAGQQAMQDTMGNAALLTGGYGNSYATTAGQQAYNSYMQQMADKIPELEQYAYQKYLNEGNELYNQSNLLQQLDSTDYGRYRDTVSDYLNDRDYYYSAYNNERNFDYGKYRDNVSDWQSDRSYNRAVYESDRDFDYGKQQDAQAQDNWQKQFDYNKTQDALAQENWQKSFDRSNYESDRNYNRSVYESDRNFDYAKQQDAQSQANWEKQFDYNKTQDAFQNNLSLRKIVADEAASVDEDATFDPSDAYEFISKYKDYTNSDEEVAESLMQMYGAQDGFWDWADKIQLDNGTLSDVLMSMYPEFFSEEENLSWGEMGSLGANLSLPDDEELAKIRRDEEYRKLTSKKASGAISR